MFLQGHHGGATMLLDTLLKIKSGFQEHVRQYLAPKVRHVDFVYHYTTIPALLSILKNNELWLSHSSFMNDPNEIEFGVGFILHLLDQSVRAKTVADLIRKQRAQGQMALDLYQELPFLLSFTELRDDVAPWVQYADDGSGVHIEFVQSKILPTFGGLVPASKHIHFPVQYFSSIYAGVDSNVAGFDQTVLDFYLGIEEFVVQNGLSNDFQAQNALFSVTKLLASIIKHEFHKAEREWRFVLLAGPGDSSISVLPYGSSARMVYKMGFGKGRVADVMQSIKLGPKHRRDERVSAALEQAIRRGQTRDWNVSFSEGLLRREET
jgi:hypothetical protein